jgi:hypothetical protein
MVILQNAKIRLVLLLDIWFWCGGVVAYYSGRQSIVASCTVTAKTIALTKLVVKIKHMRALLFDLQCRQEQETIINSTCVWVDNTAAIAVATGKDSTHETVKHVAVKLSFLRSVCNAGSLWLRISRRAEKSQISWLNSLLLLSSRNTAIMLWELSTPSTDTIGWRKIRFCA